MPGKKQKIFLSFIIFVLVLFVIAIGFIIKQKFPDPKEPEVPVLTQIETSQLPPGIPADIPKEEEVEIIQNYLVEVSDQAQATRVFVTRKSLEKNYELYKKWLSDNGWEIIATMDEVNLKAIVAKKDNSQLNITLNTNTLTGENTVNLTHSKIK